MSGTSQAAPLVAAAAALYLERHPQALPAEVQRAVVLSGAYGRLAGVPAGTANLLLNTAVLPAAGSDPLRLDTDGIEVRHAPMGGMASAAGPRDREHCIDVRQGKAIMCIRSNQRAMLSYGPRCAGVCGPQAGNMMP